MDYQFLAVLDTKACVSNHSNAEDLHLGASFATVIF